MPNGRKGREVGTLRVIYAEGFRYIYIHFSPEEFGSGYDKKLENLEMMNKKNRYISAGAGKRKPYSI